MKIAFSEAPEKAIFTLRDPATGRIFEKTVAKLPFLPPAVEVTWREGLWLVSVYEFSSVTTETLDRQRALFESGAPVVIDLRYNAGGSVEAAVRFLSRFVPPERSGAQVIELLYRLDSADRLHVVDPPRRVRAPVTVLTSAATASAAEIVLSGLKSLTDAATMGEATFGKCHAQDSIRLPGGVLTYSVAEIVWNGRVACAQRGLEPDIAVTGAALHDTEGLLERVRTRLRLEPAPRTSAVKGLTASTLTGQAATRLAPRRSPVPRADPRTFAVPDAVADPLDSTIDWKPAVTRP